jgi:hypothetical protein
MGVYEFAVSDLSLAIRIDKQCMLAYYNRGCCYQKMKETQKVTRIPDVTVLKYVIGVPDICKA